MKKYISKIFILVIFFLLTSCIQSKAAILTLTDDELVLLFNQYEKVITGQETKDLIDKLVADYGYDQSELLSPLRISTTVSIVGESRGDYCVQLGNKKLTKMELKSAWQNFFTTNYYVSKEILKNVLGYEESFGKIEKGKTSWRVVIEATAEGPTKAKLPSTESSFEMWDYKIVANKVWSGQDADEMWGTQPETSTEVDADEESFVDKAKEIQEFLSHIVESVVSAILDFIVLLGDGFQRIANVAQTLDFEHIDILYSPNDIGKKDGNTNNSQDEDANSMSNPKNVNSYVNFSKDISTYDIAIDANDIDGESHGFTADTPIPVIVSDVYTLATNKVDIINTNFLLKTETGDKSLIATVRNFIASIIHAVMYIIAVMLLMSLIWHGIGIVKASITGSPQEKNSHMIAIQKLAIATAMLVGTLIIEALCIYLSNMVFEGVEVAQTENKYEGPIRVAVKDNVYSFSTTPTGYVRYMAGIDNIYLYGKRSIYAITYLFLAIGNLVLTIAMIVRTILMMFFAVVGFIIIAIYVFKAKYGNTRGYTTWVKIYAEISFLQTILAIIARVMIEIIID